MSLGLQKTERSSCTAAPWHPDDLASLPTLASWDVVPDSY